MKIIGRFIGATHHKGSYKIIHIVTSQGQKNFDVDLEESKKQLKDIKQNDIISIEYKNVHDFIIEKTKIHCPKCNLDDTRFSSYKMTKNGLKKLYICKACHKEITI